MATASRTIQIKFDGTARGLIKASRDAAKAIESVEKRAGKTGAKFGSEVATGLLDQIKNMGAMLKGPAIAVAGVVATAMAPLIAATIAAAVIGGVGAGGIAGGIALASRDPRVKASAERLADHVTASFSRAAEPMVAPALAALDVLRDAVDDVALDVKGMFSEVAPLVVPLTRGLVGLVKQALPGVTAAMRSARPLLLVLSAELPKIGRAIGEFFRIVSEDPRGAIMAVQTLSKLIQGAIIFTAKFVAVLSAAWAKIGPALMVVQGDFAGAAVAIVSMEAAMAEAKKMADGTAGSLDNLSESTAQAEQKVLLLNDAMDKLFGQAMGVEQATIRYEKSWDALVKELQNGKRTLDATTEAGQNNRGAILDQIQAIKDLRQANIDNKMPIEQANALYQQQIERLRGTANGMRFNRDEVNQLINAFANLPRLAEIEVRVPGLLAAIDQARELSRLLGSTSAAARERAGDRSGFGGGRQHGGDVRPFTTYLVGEHEPEILTMGARSGRVTPLRQVATAAPADDRPIIVENHIEIGGEVVRVVRTEIRESNRGLHRAVVAGAGAR